MDNNVYVIGYDDRTGEPIYSNNKPLILEYALDDNAYPPEKAYQHDAGFDIRTPYRFIIRPRGSVSIDTGLHVQIPVGYYGYICSKSGLNFHGNLITTGVIDSGYTGSIKVKLYSLGFEEIVFEAGAKIAQMVILPVPMVFPKKIDISEFDTTERGASGFGSTGR